jgi:hypothetical protein
MPKLQYVGLLPLFKSSIRHGSNTLAPHILVRLEKVHNAGKKAFFQRDLTGVETRLKRSVLINYIVAKFAF